MDPLNLTTGDSPRPHIRLEEFYVVISLLSAIGYRAKAITWNMTALLCI